MGMGSSLHRFMLKTEKPMCSMFGEIPVTEGRNK